LLVGFGGGRFLDMALEKKAVEFAKSKLVEELTKTVNK
jgi:hypothetical protein